ncbi:hypothetical protein BKA62DRAFT_721422 [Auriculariales sp. MPI-PUGE-AT-0066]|nr:hypothetical protein BKA62DRAFT_721422 [Auriculariales sp. MPI-PUGE-AT-0066]
MSTTTMSSTPVAAFLATLPEFSSASRVSALYSDVARQKQSEQAQYERVVSFWQRILEELLAHGLQTTGEDGGDTLVLHANDALLESLRWQKQGKPRSLGCAVVDATTAASSSGPPRLIPVSIYTPSSLIYRAARTLVGVPLWWALQQLSLVGRDDPEHDGDDFWKRAKGDYVVLSNLEKAAQNIIQHQYEKPHVSLVDSLYSLSSFKKEFAENALPEATLSGADIKVLLRHLTRDKQVLVFEQEVVKFAAEGKEPEPVTEVDLGVLQMQNAVNALETQIDELQKQIAERTSKITTALCAGESRKPLALSYLRSRKQLEDLLSKRLGSLEVLQTQLTAVERAVGDAEIIQAYETSTRTLRTALARPELQRERVDATLENMAEALADQREIDDAIRAGEAVAVGEQVDDDELASELAALAKEAHAEQEADERKQKEHEEKEKEERQKVEARQKEAEQAKEDDEMVRRLSALKATPDTTSQQAKEAEAAS